MTRRSATIALAIVLATVAITSCGVPTNEAPRAVPDAEVPDALREVPTSTPPGAAGESPQEQVSIWFARGDQLVAALHRIPGAATAPSAIADLLVGPSETDRGHGLRTAIADPDAVGSVTTARGAATVELTDRFAELPASDQVVAIAQIVLTATDLRGIGRVRFLLAGQDVAVPLPDGTTTLDAVTRDDYLDLTAPARPD